MLTKVVLEGPMGERFGREWELQINSPREALSIIDANSPGIYKWVRDNLDRYSHYQVVCETADGRVHQFTQDEYQNVVGKYAGITFVPLIAGAGTGVLQAIVGVILIVVGYFLLWTPFGAPMIAAGIGLLAGGIAQMLSARPKKDIGDKAEENKPSYFFNGAANTTEQGVPVQLIYGRVMAGSHVVSAAMSVDQLMGA